MGEVPIDEGWAWMTVLGAFVNMYFVVGGFKTMGIFFVEFLRKFQASKAVTAILMGLISGNMSLFSPLVTAVCHRFSNRVASLIGGFFVSLAMFLTAFATDIAYVICVNGIITGIGFAFLFVPSLVTVGQYFDKRRALANGMALAGASIGQLTIPYIITYLIDEYGFEGAIIIYSGIILHTIPASALFRPPEFFAGDKFTMSKPVHENVSVKATRKAPAAEKIAVSREGEEVDIDCDKDNLRGSKHGANSHGSNQDINLQDSKPDNYCHGSKKDDLSKSVDSLSFKRCLDEKLTSTPHDPDGIGPVSTRARSSDKAARRRLLPESSPSEDKADLEGVYLSTGSLCFGVDEDEDYQYDAWEKRNVAESPPEPKVSNMVRFSRKIFGCPDFKDKENSKRAPPLYNCPLLTELSFVLYVLCICFANCGYVDLILFIPPYAKDSSYSDHQVALALSIGGLADFFGRIFGGWFASMNYFSTDRIICFSLYSAALSSVVCICLPSYASLITMAAALGCLGGTYIALFPVVLVEIIGLERFPGGFGLTIMFMGLTNLGLPSLIGQMRDVQGSYQVPFLICAVLMALGATCLVLDGCIKALRRRTKGKRSLRETRIPEDGDDDDQKAPAVDVTKA